jgi:putative glycosyltransferase
MKLTVVATLYRSAPYLEEFHRRVRAAAEAITDNFEIILVNDGSPDDSLERALALHARDARVTVLDLARNFGHHKAMVTGLAHADGDLVFLIDSDLEEPPELLAGFHAEVTSGGWDIVYGVQSSRRGGWFERLSGAAFFKLTEMLSDVPLPRNLITARLMTRDFVRALVAHQDRQAQLSLLTALTGFRQRAMQVEKLAHSPTTYSFARKLNMALQQITTTSTRLLNLVLYLGAGVSALAICLIAFYLLRYLTHGVRVDGFTSLIMSIWFLGGATLLALGVLGIYINNILVEVQRRPYTHLRAVYRAPTAAIVASETAQ